MIRCEKCNKRLTEDNNYYCGCTKYVDFKGRRFYPPFRCLCCGKGISAEQFCWGRTCGYCDMGKCNLAYAHDKSNYMNGKIIYEEGHGRKDIFEQAEVISNVKVHKKRR